MEYDLELGKVVESVKKHGAKSVLIQLADGLKPHADKVVEAIEKNTSARVLIWFGQCFGGCDIPVQMKNKVDLVIQFGHNMFIKNSAGWE